MDLFVQYTVDSPDRSSLQLLLALGGLVVIVGVASLGTFIFSKTGLKKVSEENRSASLNICYFLLSFSLVVCFVAGTSGYLDRLNRDYSLQVAEDKLASVGVDNVDYDWDSRTYVGTFEGETFLGKKIELPNGEFGIVRVKDKDATVVAVK